MQVINEVISFFSMGVQALGGVIAVLGVIDYMEGRSKNQAASKDEGVNKIVSGAVIFLIGLKLVPQISSFFG